MIDTVFYNGTILTQDPRARLAEAVAVSGGRIQAVGAWSDIEAATTGSTTKVDLTGGTLLPGFNDAHAHIWKIGQMLTSILDLRPVRSFSELFERLRARDRELPDDVWLVGRGYNEALMIEARQPTRDDLDAVVSHRPVALTRTCGHMMVVNTRVLERAGVTDTTADPSGGAIVRDERGRATGLLQETAMGFAKDIMPDPSVDAYASMIEAANRAQLAKGITSVSEAGAYADLVKAYRRLERDGRLNVRANVMAMRLADEHVASLPLPERFLSDTLRVDSVKLFADGGLSGATAALSSRYRHRDTTGLLRVDEDELVAVGREALDAGLRVCTHAIGDRAIDCVLGAYERLGARGQRIEHFGLPTKDHLARARNVGAIVVPQTIFIDSLGPNFRRYLTDAFLERTYPVRSMLDAGLTVALSSDAPVVPDDDPLVGIRAAVTRRDMDNVPIAPGEAIRIDEALFAYTMGGALASGDADNRGSVTPGKWADFVILDRDPTKTPAEELGSVRAVRTYVAGELRFSA